MAAAYYRLYMSPHEFTDKESLVLAEYAEAACAEIRQLREALWPFVNATSLSMQNPGKLLSFAHYHAAWKCFPEGAGIPDDGTGTPVYREEPPDA